MRVLIACEESQAVCKAFRAAEARNSLLAPYWRGMRNKTEEYLNILKRLLGGDADV